MKKHLIIRKPNDKCHEERQPGGVWNFVVLNSGDREGLQGGNTQQGQERSHGMCLGKHFSGPREPTVLTMTRQRQSQEAVTEVDLAEGAF